MSEDEPDWLNLAVAPEGVAYRWVARGAYDVSCVDNVAKCLANGWLCVEPTQHPEFPISASGSAIEFDNLVLMKKPKEWVDRERLAVKQMTDVEVKRAREAMGYRRVEDAGKVAAGTTLYCRNGHEVGRLAQSSSLMNDYATSANNDYWVSLNVMFAPHQVQSEDSPQRCYECHAPLKKASHFRVASQLDSKINIGVSL